MFMCALCCVLPAGGGTEACCRGVCVWRGAGWSGWPVPVPASPRRALPHGPQRRALRSGNCEWVSVGQYIQVLHNYIYMKTKKYV